MGTEKIDRHFYLQTKNPKSCEARGFTKAVGYHWIWNTPRSSRKYTSIFFKNHRLNQTAFQSVILRHIHTKVTHFLIFSSPLYNHKDELILCFSIFSALHTERFPEFHVDWHAINDVVSYSEYTPSKLVRSVTSKLGFSKSKLFQNWNEN